MKNSFILFLFCVSILGCKQKSTKTETTASVQEIVDKAITHAGGASFNKKEICFDFRGKEYFSLRNNWKYEFHRTEIDSSGTGVTDVLTNDGFKRYIEDSLVEVADSMAQRYGNSVNSVHYFAYLPYGLNDKAVNKELIGEVLIKEQPYYKVKVTFDQESGGDDFDDVYLYWIHKSDFTVDYLAYEFHVNGGGLRFREAFNRRDINGIYFTDYNNYKPKNKEVKLYDLDQLFESGQLELLSKIELENIYVQNCSSC